MLFVNFTSGFTSSGSSVTSDAIQRAVFRNEVFKSDIEHRAALFEKNVITF